MNTFLNFSLCFLLIGFLDFTKGFYSVLSRIPAVIEGDLGSRLTLHCNLSRRVYHHIHWRKDNQELGGELSWTVYQHRGAIVSQSLQRNDAGNYSCSHDNHSESLSGILSIRTPPGKLENVTVRPTSVLATIRWTVGDTGRLPLTHFTLSVHDLYQGEAHGKVHNGSSTRTHLPIHISPNARQFFVYHLHPSSSYMFRMWASNRLGAGEPTTVYVNTPKAVYNITERSGFNGSGNFMFPHLVPSTDDLSGLAWLIAVAMVLGTVALLSCISCLLIYKEGSANQSESLLTDAEDHSVSSAASQDNLNGNGSSSAEPLIPPSPARFFFPFHRAANQRSVQASHRTTAANHRFSSNSTSQSDQRNYNGGSAARRQLGERSFLLDHVDYNDNNEAEPVRLNNNSVVRPSIV